MDSKQYAEVVVNAPLGKSLHYRIPDALSDQIKIGRRVKVPLGKRLVGGYCVGLTSCAPVVKEIKDVVEVQDGGLSLREGMLRLTQEISKHYLCPWGVAIEAVLPSPVKRGLKTKKTKALRLIKDKEAISTELALLKKRAPRQASALSALLEAGEGMALKELSQLSGCSPAGLQNLARRRLVEFYDLPPQETLWSGKPKSPPFVLTSEQQKALDIIRTKLREGGFGVVLLQGVTSSGKTEVYLQAIQEAVTQGLGAIVLVPEVSLTPQTVERFQARFDGVAVLHSYLSEAEHNSQWHAVAEGRAQVVIGARSAVFAPLERLGLIVVDEEHETAYKQENPPRYHARDVAIMRARQEGAVVVLGSATPSLESYFNALTGKYEGVTLTKRIGDRPLPKVEIVDMKGEFHVGRGTRLLSHRLEHYMKQSLSKGEQVILFLNRRGFSPFVSCPRCGFVLKCGRCDIALTYHKKDHIALCHYCHKDVSPPQDCPDCAGAKLNYFGLGTERIEEEIRRSFPEYKSIRMDSDTMRGQKSHERAFQTFQKGEAQILIGTQMIAKGLDFPNVTLVGVISADTVLNLPDFRACERTFQLLAQVAGRTGRGPKGGRVVIQSFNPKQYAILAAANHDYHGFAQKELEYRRALGYPPFGCMVRVLFRGRKEGAVREKALEMANTLKEMSGDNGQRMEVIGPAPAPIPRIRNMSRWNLILKARSYTAITEALEKVSRNKTSRGVREIIDVDPYNML